MKKRKFITKSIIATATLFAILIGTVITKDHQNFSVHGAPTQYSILFQSHQNKIATGGENPSGYNGSGNAVTELGNNIAFDYQGLVNPTAYWQTLIPGGYLTNTEPITGMTTLNLEKANSSAHIGVYWSETTSFDATRYVEFATSTPLEISTNFDGYKPNYIKIVALGGIASSINSATLIFHCIDYYPSIGSTIGFGTYPQSQVTDTTLISTLDTGAGTLPTADNSQAWTDYGYYVNGNVSSYMWYIDMTSGTEKYRGVYFTSYRTNHTTSSNPSYQNRNGYSVNVTYWFKFEPVSWKILDTADGKIFLLADLVLDSQDFYYGNTNRTEGGNTIYPNNYQYSHIRSWLNTNFYNTAFTTDEKNMIATTNVDNSAASTGYGTNKYACPNTYDKIFLLSHSEVTCADYGFALDASRIKEPSAYALSQGIYVDNSSNTANWWLRSPANNYMAFGLRVGVDGGIHYNGIYCTSYGIVPAMWISL